MGNQSDAERDCPTYGKLREYFYPNNEEVKQLFSEVREKAVATPFKDFVSKQPSDRPVDHSMGWNNCVVGNYLQEALGCNSWQVNVLIDNEIQEDDDLWPAGMYFLLGWSNVAEQHFPTYGDIYNRFYGG